MIYQDAISLAAVLGLILTLGGCYCCQVCQYCTDNMSTMTFDVGITDDQCNGGCASLAGTYVVDMDETCCASYASAPYPCDTTPCSGCAGTPSGSGLVCCDPDSPFFPSDYCANDPEALLGTPSCTGDANYNTCNDTAGCSVSTTPTQVDNGCVSDINCDDYFGAGVAGYSCTRDVTCDNACTCASVELAVSACITTSGGNIHLTGTAGDGYRSYTFDETLGASPSVDCLTAISSLPVTLSETANGFTNQLCAAMTLTITGGT